MQKKLLSALFQNLVVTDTGIKVFYHLAESKNLITTIAKTKKPSEKTSDGDSISNFRTSQTLGFFVSKSSPIHWDGGGSTNLLEPDPLTVKIFIRFLWVKEQLNLMALARFRWVERWGIERLAEYFGVGTTAIKHRLAKIRLRPHIVGLSISPPNIRGR